MVTPKHGWCEGPIRAHLSSPESNESTPLTINKPFARLGRLDTCEIHLNDQAVSRLHLYVQQVDGGKLFLSDLGSRTGVRINGVRTSEAWLDPDAVVKIGPYSLRFDCVGFDGKGLCARDKHLADWYVTAQSKGMESVTFRLDRPLTFIGRSKPSEIRLQSRTVAYVHAATYVQSTGIWMINLFGEEVSCNREPIDYCGIKDGDEVQIGRYTLTYTRQPPQSESAAPLESATVAEPSVPSIVVPSTSGEPAIKVDVAQIEQLHADLAGLQRHAELLQDEKKRLSRELTVTNERLNRLDRLADEMAAYTRRIEDELRDERETTRQLSVNIKTLEDQVNTLETNRIEELASQASFSATSGRDVGALKETIERLSEEFRELQKDNATTQDSNRSALRELGTLQTQVAGIPSLAEQVALLSRGFDEFPETIRAHSTNLHEAMGVLSDQLQGFLAIDDAESRFSQCKQELAALEERIESVEIESSTASTRLTSVDRELERIDSLDKNVADFTNGLQAVAAEIDKRSTEVAASVESRIHECQLRLFPADEASARFQELRERLRAVNGDLNEVRNRTDGTHALLAEVREQILGTATAVDGCREVLRQLRDSEQSSDQMHSHCRQLEEALQQSKERLRVAEENCREISEKKANARSFSQPPNDTSRGIPRIGPSKPPLSPSEHPANEAISASHNISQELLRKSASARSPREFWIRAGAAVGVALFVVLTIYIAWMNGKLLVHQIQVALEHLIGD